MDQIFDFSQVKSSVSSNASYLMFSQINTSKNFCKDSLGRIIDHVLFFLIFIELRRVVMCPFVDIVWFIFTITVKPNNKKFKNWRSTTSSHSYPSRKGWLLKRIYKQELWKELLTFHAYLIYTPIPDLRWDPCCLSFYLSSCFCPILHVFLVCLFLIVPSIFSNVYQCCLATLVIV